MTNQKPKVLISIPNRAGRIHKDCVFALFKLAQDLRVQTNIILPTHCPFVNNLHKIRLDFLQGDYDYWLSFDDDNPPKNNPLDLVFLEKHVIGCPTPVWHDAVPGDQPYYYNAYKKNGNGYLPWDGKPEGLTEVDAVGTGCILLSRQVMETITAPFMRTWDTDGVVEKGNDIAFCERAKSLGFSIYCHWDYVCEHYVEVPLLSAIQSFNNMRKNNGN